MTGSDEKEIALGSGSGEREGASSRQDAAQVTGAPRVASFPSLPVGGSSCPSSAAQGAEHATGGCRCSEVAGRGRESAV
jgi:hypothetical protein